MEDSAPIVKTEVKEEVDVDEYENEEEVEMNWTSNEIKMSIIRGQEVKIEQSPVDREERMEIVKKRRRQVMEEVEEELKRRGISKIGRPRTQIQKNKNKRKNTDTEELIRKRKEKVVKVRNWREQMTPEERRMRYNENMRRKYAEMSPEEKEEYLRRHSENARRRKKKERTPEEKERIKRMKLETGRRQRENIRNDPVRRELERQKKLVIDRNRRARMTEEEKEAQRQRRSVIERNRRERMTEEEKEAKRQRRLVNDRNRRARMAPEEKEEVNRKRNESSKRKKAEMKDQEQEPEMQDAELEKKKAKNFNAFVKRATLSDEERERRRQRVYFQKLQRKLSMSPEELKEFKRKRQESWWKRVKSLTGERKERHDAAVKRAIRKQMEKNREKRALNFTPEQRFKQLQYYRIGQAKRNLRKKLEKNGATSEDIEREVEQLVERMKSEPMPPAHLISKYKPRQPKEKEKSETENELNCDNTTDWEGEASQAQENENDKPTSPVDLFTAKTDTLTSEIEVDIDYQDNDNAEDNDYQSDSGPSSPLGHEEEGHSSPEGTDASPYFVASSSTTMSTASHLEEVSAASTSSTSSALAPPSNLKICTASSRTGPAMMWTCPICREALQSFQDFTGHYKVAHQKPSTTSQGKEEVCKPVKKLNYICMKCKVSSQSQFSSKEYLLAHVKRFHPKSFFPCPHCNLLKYNANFLKTHLTHCQHSKRKL